MTKFFKRIFVPEYSELSLFVMSFSCLLFFLTDIEFFKTLHFKISENQFGIFIIYLIVFAGILLSFYHAFSKRKKTSIEKDIMLLFAAFLNGFTGLWAGAYFLGQAKGIFLVFPTLNILSGYILLGSIRKTSGGIDESRISDTNVKFIEVIISSLIAAGIFLMSKYYFHQVWAVTLSLCIVYATNLSAPVVYLITGSMSKINARTFH